MRKHFYKLAIGLFGLFGIIAANAQNACDETSMYSSYGVSGFEPEFIQCDHGMPYTISATQSTNDPLVIWWTTAQGEVIAEGPTFNDDTTGEFYMMVEGTGCFAEKPFKVFDAPELFIDADKYSYCSNEQKPTIIAEVLFIGNQPQFPGYYNINKDGQPFLPIIGWGDIKDAEAGVYELKNDDQQCWGIPGNSPVVEITEEDCSPENCTPASLEVYGDLVGNAYEICHESTAILNYPVGQSTDGLSIEWLKNGEVYKTDKTSIIVFQEQEYDFYQINVTGQGCSWQGSFTTHTDIIDAGFTSSDPNYRTCTEEPLVLTANGNPGLTDATYEWQIKTGTGRFEKVAEGPVFTVTEPGNYQLHVYTEHCFEYSSLISVEEKNCGGTSCPEMWVEKSYPQYPQFPSSPVDQGYVAVCDQNFVMLQAFVTSGSGTVTWYDYSSGEEVNAGGNPLYTTWYGKYIARYTDGNCTVESDTIWMDVWTSPDVHIVPVINDEVYVEPVPGHRSEVVCEGATVDLKSDPYYHIQYYWEKDGAFISSAPEISNADAGYYTLLVENYEGCISDASLSLEFTNSPDCVISSVDGKFDASFELAPNPTTGHVNIIGSGISTVKIVTQMGQTSILDVKGGSIDLSNYQSGVYNVIIERSGNVETHRIVKQ